MEEKCKRPFLETLNIIVWFRSWDEPFLDFDAAAHIGHVSYDIQGHSTSAKATL